MILGSTTIPLKEKDEQYEKINSYIPSYLHKQFPSLKSYNETISSNCTSQKIRKKLNLTSNNKINTGRGVMNEIKIRMSNSNSIYPVGNHTNNILV